MRFRWVAAGVIALALVILVAWYAWPVEAEPASPGVEPTPTIASTPVPTLPLLIAGPPTTRTPTPTWTPIAR